MLIRSEISILIKEKKGEVFPFFFKWQKKKLIFLVLYIFFIYFLVSKIKKKATLIVTVPLMCTQCDIVSFSHLALFFFFS
jgi:hypothetical protein